MSRRSLLAFGCMTLLSVSAVTHDQAQPSCCAKPAKCADSRATTKPEKGEKLK